MRSRSAGSFAAAVTALWLLLAGPAVAQDAPETVPAAPESTSELPPGVLSPADGDEPPREDTPDAAETPETAVIDARAIIPSPLNRALRSAAIPAWGQVTNGKAEKAVLQFGVQAYLLTRIIIESREGGESLRTADRLRGLDSEAFAGQISVAEAKADDHFSRRRDLLFWWIIAGFYGALDAYVDAHLVDFDRELEEGRELFSGVDPVEKRVELGIRF